MALISCYLVTLGGGILGMTGRMTFPKAESVWMKYPELVLFAVSKALPTDTCAGASDMEEEGTEDIPREELPDLISFFSLASSSRIFLC